MTFVAYNLTQCKEGSMIKKFSFLICSLVIVMNLAACNTTKGVGKDIEASGEAIQRAAE